MSDATFLDGLLGSTDGKVETTASKLGTIVMILGIVAVVIFAVQWLIGYFDSRKRERIAYENARLEASRPKKSNSLKKMLPLLLMQD